MSEQPTRTSFPKDQIKVLLMEGIAQTAVREFKEEGYQIECIQSLTPEELKEKIKDVRIIGVRSKTKLTKDVLECAKKLKCVGCFCIGTDQTDLDYAASRAITVFNAPFANTRSVAEMVVSEIICLARQIGDRNMECHNGTWNKRSKGCYEIRGKKLGIIGYGHVGSQASILAEAMGMDVFFYDILKKLPLGNATACRSMEEILEKCDFVSLHVPGTKLTENLIGEKEINMMRKGSYLLNLSRGKVVDVEAAAKALRSGHLAGGAFDVYPSEPGSKADPFESVLRGCPNTILTPHIGGSTEEAQASIGEEVAYKLIKFMNTGNTMDSVNFPKVALPFDEQSHRVLNVHHNVPGVLKSINEVLCEYNVAAQMLMTRGLIGYLMVDVDKEVSKEIKEQLMGLEHSISTRVLF